MKIAAVVLAVVLSAASMWAQAIVGYAGAAAASGTTTAGAASKLGDSGMGGLHRKMGSAMGNTGSRATKPGAHVQSAPANSGVHSEIHCKSRAQATSREQCVHEKQGAGTEAAGKVPATGKETSGVKATQNEGMKITFVGVR